MTTRWLLTALLVAGAAAGGGVAALGGPRSTEPLEPLAIAAMDNPAGKATTGLSWEALLAAGEAVRRIGDATGAHDEADAKARQLYRSALSQARQQASLDGVLRAAEALAEVGDHEGVKESMRIAKALAGSDPEARADLRSVETEIADSRC
jgi:hypothetical protein